MAKRSIRLTENRSSATSARKPLSPHCVSNPPLAEVARPLQVSIPDHHVEPLAVQTVQGPFDGVEFVGNLRVREESEAAARLAHAPAQGGALALIVGVREIPAAELLRHRARRSGVVAAVIADDDFVRHAQAAQVALQGRHVGRQPICLPIGRQDDAQRHLLVLLRPGRPCCARRVSHVPASPHCAPPRPQAPHPPRRAARDCVARVHRPD